MKTKIVVALAIISVTLMAASKINETGTKLGYLNSQIMLYLMPEMDSVTKQVQEYAKLLQTDYDEMVKEYETKKQEYFLNRTKWSDGIKKIKEEELVTIEQKIVKFEQLIQTELRKKQQLLLQPLAKDLEAAIDAVAKEKGIDYVFDLSSGALLHYPEGESIADAVKTKLSIPLDKKLPESITGNTGTGNGVSPN